eukprot:TRINITY_DN116566_c0_g1_i1.p1 TRINITY_DN116566_c0_g1~~TRINITY_DN116566_c0_g1_i1.p1  ORF type:complete len:333 (+),score=3.84 TRINITY_DN116566_c0_g1_i1:36-1001(+)
MQKLKVLQFLMCAGGIYTCYLVWGIVQEKLTSTQYVFEDGKRKFNFFVFLNLLQAATAAVLGLVLAFFSGQCRFPRDLLVYTQVGITMSVGPMFGYWALRYIDYPLLLLSKSSKLIPVMLMKVVLYRVKFGIHQYISVLLITVGLVGFSYKPRDEGGQGATYLGIFLVFVNLVFDGFTNSTQDDVVKKHKPTSLELMGWNNAFSAASMVLYLLASQFGGWSAELSEGIAFLQHNEEARRDVITFCVCGAVGMLVIFYTIRTFGTLTLVKITLTRKMMNIILSVIWYNHQISTTQWTFAGFVFIGIAVETLYRPPAPKAKKP